MPQTPERKPLVLIAEDEFLIALEIRAMLEECGLSTTAPVARGCDAVALALREPPDLLVMDIRLRDDVDGVEAAALIVARHPVPVIFLTAFADADIRKRIARIARATLLVKPTVPATLRAAIDQALGRRLPSPGPGRGATAGR